MKRYIKVVCAILVVALFVTMALGSGSDSKKEVQEPASVTTNSTPAEKTENGVSAAETPAETADQETAPAEQEPVSQPQVTVAQTVLLDTQNVKITLTGYDGDDLFGPEFKLLVENNSAQNLTFSADRSSVNGYMVDAMFSCDVAAGKKANSSLSVLSSDLEACGVTRIGQLEFIFHIYDSDSWDTYLDSDPVTVKTSAADSISDTFDNSGYTVCNENGIEIVLKGLSRDDSVFGPGIVVYISNTSGRDICVEAENVSVNGFMVDSYFYEDVVSGKHAVDAITFYDFSLEENGISQITDVELSFHVIDEDSWDTVLDTGTITVSFN